MMTATGNDGIRWNCCGTSLSHAIEVDVIGLVPDHKWAFRIRRKCCGETGLVDARVHPFGVARIGFELATKRRKLAR